MSTHALYMSRKLAIFLPPPGICCSAISIWQRLLFFSCNQTHRFVSVALRHQLNQFPSTLPSGRAAVKTGTLQLGTHLDTCALFSHSLDTYKTHRGAHTLADDSPHHCSLMSYLLHLCYIHLSPLTGPGSSVYPFSFYPCAVSPHSVFLSANLCLPPARSLSELEAKKWYTNSADTEPCLALTPRLDTWLFYFNMGLRVLL